MSLWNQLTGNHPYNAAGTAGAAGAAAPPPPPAPIPGPIPVPPPAAPIDPAADGFGSAGDGFDPAPVEIDPDIPAGTGPAPGEAPAEPPADAAGTEGAPTDGAAPDEGAPTGGADTGEDTGTGDEGSDEGSSSDEDEGGADPAGVVLSQPETTFPLVVYAIWAKGGHKERKIGRTEVPADFDRGLAAALQAHLRESEIELSGADLKGLVAMNVNYLTQLKKMELTVCDFNPSFETSGESSPALKAAMLEDYLSKQAKAGTDTTLEDDLRKALAELAKVNFGKFNNIGRMAHIKPAKSGKKLTPDDFLRQTKSPDDRKAMLELVQEFLESYKASNPDPAPTT